MNQTVGASARATLEKTVRLLYQSQPHHLEGMDFDALHALLDPVQDAIAPQFVKPYPGLSDFLRQLGELDIKLAICTSGTPHHVVRNFGAALPELGMDRLSQEKDVSAPDKLKVFSAKLAHHYNLPAFTVVTCDDTTTHKPDPAGLELAMKRLDVCPAESLVLGDHKVDMQAGMNAGVVQRVGITHGFDDRDVLLSGGATLVVDSLAGLVESLRAAD